MKKYTKLLVLLLSVALICCGLVIAVSADDTAVELVTLIDSATADENGVKTVTLESNATISEDIWVASDLVIDLNGYTLTSTTYGAFSFNKDVEVTVTGDGVIEVANTLVYSNMTDGTNFTFNLKGSVKGIVINHNAANQSLVRTTTGNINFTNAKIDSDIVSLSLFRSVNNDDDFDPNPQYSIIGCDITASKLNAYSVSVFELIHAPKGYLHMDYCNVRSNGSVITVPTGTNGKDGVLLDVNNSYLSAIFTGTASNKSNEVAVVGCYSNPSAEMIFSNCVLTSSFRTININTNNSNGKVILKNGTVLTHNSSNNLGRGGPIYVEAGSVIATASDGCPLTNDTGYYIYLYEGARFNSSVYRALTYLVDVTEKQPVLDENNNPVLNEDGTPQTTTVTVGKVIESNYDRIRFVEVNEDGTETIVKPTESTKLTVTYDPFTNSDYPYIVTAISDKATPIFTLDENNYVTVSSPAKIGLENYVSWSGEDFDYSSQYNVSGTRRRVTIEGNSAWSYTLNGTVANNTEGKPVGPSYMFGPKTGILESKKDLFVMEFDIATNAKEGFIPGTFDIHARGTASGSSPNLTSTVFTLLADGTVKFKNNAVCKLNMNEWNRVTYVIETKTATTGAAYIFINGEYIGATSAYTGENLANNGAGCYIFGPRFNSSIKDDTTGNNLLIDNIGVRTYGDGTFKYTVNSESQAREYLTNGGLPSSNNRIDRTVYDDINIAGIGFENLSDAITAANAVGATVQLNGNINVAQLVKQNAIVSANGYTVVFDSESYPSNIVYDSEGNIYYYEIDSKYNDYSITYKWFVGNSEAKKELDQYWYTTTVKAGSSPVDTFDYGELKVKLVPGADYLFADHIGWALTENATENDASLDNLVSVSEVIANNGKTVTVFPVWGTPVSKGYKAILLDSNGDFKSGTDQTTLYGSRWTGAYNMKLDYGDTYVVLCDSINFCAAIGSSRVNKDVDKVFNIDLNGHVAKTSFDGSSSKVTLLNAWAGETFNLYSSRPGARLEGQGYINSSKNSASGGVLVKIESNNVTYNIGTVTVRGETYPGSNLTIGVSLLVDVNKNGASSTVNVDGINLIRCANDYAGLIIARENASAAVNVKNANIFLPTDETLVGGVSANGSTVTTFENCTIVTKTNGQSILDPNLQKVVFNNCTTNGTITTSQENVVFVNENVSAYAISGSVVIPEGYVNAKYNVAFDFSNVTDKETISVNATVYSNSKLSLQSYVFAANGYTGEAGTVVGICGNKIVKETDAVDVTWKGLAGNADVVEKYAVGGNVVAIESMADGKLNAVKLVYNGTVAEELATNIQEAVTYTPNYTVESNITGLKANLSLYSDFRINLYIPVAYAEYIKVNGKEVTETVTIGDATYVKVVISKVAKVAAEDAVFEIAITEGEYTATATVTLSIADYAETVLKGEAYTYGDKALMYYMLNYANEAAKYFGTDATATEALLTTYAEWKVNGEVEHTYENTASDFASIFSGATIQLDDAPAFVFITNGKFEGTITITYGLNNTRTITVANGDIIEIVLDGMKIYNFGTNINVTAEGKVTDDEGNATDVSFEGVYNLESYAAYQSSKGSDCMDLVDALTEYVEIAASYKAGTLVEPEAPVEGEGETA